MRPKTGALVALTITVGATAPAAQARPTTDGVERAVVRQVNAIRGAAGLPRLRVDRRLSRAADEHSADMARRGFFSHASSDGTSMRRRVAGYAPAALTGETLAYLGAHQRGKAARVVRLWMASPAHRTTLLTRGYRRIGVARRSGAVGGTRLTMFTADLASQG